MTIKRKIQMDKVIEKGGHVGADLEAEKEWTNFCLRMRIGMSHEIDKAVRNMVGVSKTGFILQAIDEKLRGKDG